MGEKKSLALFLIIYLLSTFFLIGIAEVFYYQKIKKEYEIEEKLILKNKIYHFIESNHNLVRIKTLKNIKYPQDIKVAVFVEGVRILGNFDGNVKKDEIFVKLKIPRKKEFVVIGAMKKGDYLSHFLKELMVLNVFIIFFVIVIAYFLGKLFLKPIKREIITLESFIKDATHEMNTPIAIILSNIEMLEEAGVKIRALERIKAAAIRLGKIFSDLAYLKLHHKIEKKSIKIDVSYVLKERIEFFKPLIEVKRLKIKEDIKSKEILIDKEDLIKLIDNLLSNAIKYSPNNEMIEIILNDCLIIRNIGEIKNPEIVKKKFVRESKSEGGFGLGLFIVDRICKDYGFKFTISSQNNIVEAKICFENADNKRGQIP
ncbi:sensor histidine kinase [Caminibacter sp.]